VSCVECWELDAKESVVGQRERGGVFMDDAAKCKGPPSCLPIHFVEDEEQPALCRIAFK